MPMKEIILEEHEDEQELRVTFYPELYLQRRIWILDILRRENMTQVCDSLPRVSPKAILAHGQVNPRM
jgi:hypothetical protein